MSLGMESVSKPSVDGGQMDFLGTYCGADKVHYLHGLNTDLLRYRVQEFVRYIFSVGMVIAA